MSKLFVGIRLEKHKIEQIKDFVNKQEINTSVNAFISAAVNKYLLEKGYDMEQDIRVNYFKIADDKLNKIFRKGD